MTVESFNCYTEMVIRCYMMSNRKHIKVILKALIDTSRTFSLQKYVECMKIREVVKY